MLGIFLIESREILWNILRTSIGLTTVLTPLKVARRFIWKGAEPFLQFLPPSLLSLPFPYQGLNTLRKPATSFPRGARARKHHGKIFPTLPGIEPGIYRISIRYAAGSATLALTLFFSVYMSF